jgi:hypothetical protein
VGPARRAPIRQGLSPVRTRPIRARARRERLAGLRLVGFGGQGGQSHFRGDQTRWHGNTFRAAKLGRYPVNGHVDWRLAHEPKKRNQPGTLAPG